MQMFFVVTLHVKVKKCPSVTNALLNLLVVWKWIKNSLVAANLLWSTIK